MERSHPEAQSVRLFALASLQVFRIMMRCCRNWKLTETAGKVPSGTPAFPKTSPRTKLCEWLSNGCAIIQMICITQRRCWQSVPSGKHTPVNNEEARDPRYVLPSLSLFKKPAANVRKQTERDPVCLRDCSGAVPNGLAFPKLLKSPGVLAF